MNIAVDMLAVGQKQVERLLEEVGENLTAAMQTAANLISEGLGHAAGAGISPGLIGSVLDYAGRMQADLGHAALMLQGVHASLHEALERLAPSDDAQKSGGGGGKEPPPKP